MECEECKRLLFEECDSGKLAKEIENTAPKCKCESVSLGDGSPGPVEKHEVLFRLLISPRDYDATNQLVSKQPFDKAFANGLSVMRSVGSDDDFKEMAEDNLGSKPNAPHRRVRAVCAANVDEIKQIKDADGDPSFCVYDQTVPRRYKPELKPVPTHAGIFQRSIKTNVDGAKKYNKDLSLMIYRLFVAQQISVEDFRQNLFGEINDMAAQGRYEEGD